jgi:hypothetical protein
MPEPKKGDVTPEHYKMLAKIGFVPYRDSSGMLWFVERGEYQRRVDEGKIAGTSVQ